MAKNVFFGQINPPPLPENTAAFAQLFYTELIFFGPGNLPLVSPPSGGIGGVKSSNVDIVSFHWGYSVTPDIQRVRVSAV